MNLPLEILDRDRPQRTREQLLAENAELRGANARLLSNYTRQCQVTLELRRWLRVVEHRTRGIVVVWCCQLFLSGIALSHWWTWRTFESRLIALWVVTLTAAAFGVELWSRFMAWRQEQVL